MVSAFPPRSDEEGREVILSKRLPCSWHTAPDALKSLSDSITHSESGLRRRASESDRLGLKLQLHYLPAV